MAKAEEKERGSRTERLLRDVRAHLGVRRVVDPEDNERAWEEEKAEIEMAAARILEDVAAWLEDGCGVETRGRKAPGPQAMAIMKGLAKHLRSELALGPRSLSSSDIPPGDITKMPNIIRFKEKWEELLPYDGDAEMRSYLNKMYWRALRDAAQVGIDFG